MDDAWIAGACVMQRLAMLYVNLACFFWFIAPSDATPSRFRCAIETGSQPLMLEFFYDNHKNEAFIVGNQGLSQVLPYEGQSVITFIEPLATGSAHMISIARDGQAIYSRHTYATPLRRFIQQQYTGSCVRS